MQVAYKLVQKKFLFSDQKTARVYGSGIAADEE
jgi:hypothetical protein